SLLLRSLPTQRQLQICAVVDSGSLRSRQLRRLARREWLWLRLASARGCELGSISIRLLGERLSVWTNLGFRGAVGLCALSLWPLGLGEQSMVLGAGSGQRHTGLFACARR